ncbi:MAG TPA: hypothetical protein VFE62_29650 [Gemmataceae bacterium]|nr:hypothetical protein [Gemmataceae bacterium]
MFGNEKIMFEIYREAAYDRRFRVVYFTELDEHNKDEEIARAVAGDHVYDGFLREKTLHEAKDVIKILLDRLNRGEIVTPEVVATALADFQA